MLRLYVCIIIYRGIGLMKFQKYGFEDDHSATIIILYNKAYTRIYSRKNLLAVRADTTSFKSQTIILVFARTWIYRFDAASTEHSQTT